MVHVENESKRITTMKKYRTKNESEIVQVGPDSEGRLPPQAVDLEKKVLGALLLERETFHEVADLLKPECFYDRKHQLIYEAIESLHFNNQPLDYLIVKEQLNRMGVLEEAGGYFYIHELAEQMVSSADLMHDAQIVHQKYKARQLILFASRIQGLALDEGNDAQKVLQEAEGQLFSLTQYQVKKDFTQIAPVIMQARQNMKEAGEREDGLTGLPTGFHDLDAKTAGWQPSELIIIAARPAMGKTAFVLSMAKNMVVDYGIPTAIFSLEMSKVQLMNRLLSNASGLDSKKIKTGKLNPNELAQFDRGMTMLLGKPLYLDDTSYLSIFELRTKARRLVREHGVKIIIIDYLQLMNAQGMKFFNRQEEVSLISRSLKALAKELNIPIIALSQLNRSFEDRVQQAVKSAEIAARFSSKEKVPSVDPGAIRPNLSDLRESGAIEQDADIVCFIHRPEYYLSKEEVEKRELKRKAELIIAKHRNGEVCTINLRFFGYQTRFVNPKDDVISFDEEPKEKIFYSKLNGSYKDIPLPPVPTDDPLVAGGLDELPY